MKIYCFFLVRREINVKDFPGVKADTIVRRNGREESLYAYTPEKSIAKLFSKTRKDKLFEKRIVYMSRDEYEEFVADNEDYLLGYHSIITKTIEDNIYTLMTAEFLMTLLESDYVIFDSEAKVYNMLYDILAGDYFQYVVDYELFKPKYQAMLNDYFNLDVVRDVILHPIDSEDQLSYFQVDQLEVYVRVFGKTYKDIKKGLMRNDD